MSSPQFNESIAFITGGAQGIGLGIAKALAARGTKLAIVDIDASELAQAREELAPFTEVETYVLDVRDRDAYVKVVDHVEETLGPINLLFNNAGVSGDCAITELSYDVWDWVMGINLGGVINGIQTVLTRMVSRGTGGYVVNTASGAGLVATPPSGVLYGTSKFAVVGMSEYLRNELVRHDIGVSVLCPGPVATKIISNTATHRINATTSADSLLSANAHAQAEAFLSEGLSPESVGEMVVAAMQKNQLFIHTHDLVAALVQRRNDEILSGFPV